MGCGRAIVERLADLELSRGTVAMVWLGQQGFLIRFPQTWLLVDAYLSPSKGRLHPPVVEPDDVAGVAAILGSHDHADHIDRPMWPLLARAASGAVFIVPARWSERLADELGLPRTRVKGVDEGISITVGEVRIRALAAAHELMDRDPRTGLHAAVGFLIEGNGLRLYHAGDTCLYEGLTSRLQAERPDLMFLPINGRDGVRYRRGCIGNMTFQEAVDLAGAVRPGLVVPTHFGMFAGNTEDPERFRDYLMAKYPGVPVWIPTAGAIYRFPS